MAVPTHNDVQFKIRIPADLKERVDAAAKANSRSTTAEIVATLEKEYPDPELTGELSDFVVRFLRKQNVSLDSHAAADWVKMAIHHWHNHQDKV